MKTKLILQILFIPFILLFLNSCDNPNPTTQKEDTGKKLLSVTQNVVATKKLGAENKLYVMTGHRGCRGLLPENTIPAFLKGVELGADCIEMDVYLTKDRKVVVSHDPTLNHLFASNPDGSPVTPAQTDTLIINDMNYDLLEMYDVGKRQNPNYPEQKPEPAKIPLLSEVFQAVEDYYDQHPEVKKRVVFIVEYKATQQYDVVYHAPVPELVDSTMHQVIGVVPPERIIFHSFDPRSLNYMHKHYPEYTLEYLKEDPGIAANMDSLNFVPQFYSAKWDLMTKGAVDSIHALGMLANPWTVDTLAQMEYLIDSLGVDGIISDYPNISVAKFGDPNRSLNAKTLEFEYWEEPK